VVCSEVQTLESAFCAGITGFSLTSALTQSDELSHYDNKGPRQWTDLGFMEVMIAVPIFSSESTWMARPHVFEWDPETELDVPCQSRATVDRARSPARTSHVVSAPPASASGHTEPIVIGPSM
jgi:hypothetical protein